MNCLGKISLAFFGVIILFIALAAGSTTHTAVRTVERGGSGSGAAIAFLLLLGAGAVAFVVYSARRSNAQDKRRQKSKDERQELQRAEEIVRQYGSDGEKHAVASGKVDARSLAHDILVRARQRR
ncbi:hypothetical protein [Verrucomicrobium spinosum]|uniref:hypothetical protein n=1 Tax=Verrucomicrobium spinosum TaxID=2736 RepID=UPI00017460E3|nr:hypothetical protein [Verrucomicrobium spinosum]